MSRIVVVGAGLAGLATAYYLKARALRAGTDLELAVLEASPHPGGWVRSDRLEGFLCEWGPNGLLTSTSLATDLLRALELDHRATPASTAARGRYLYRKNALTPLPDKPHQVVTMGWLSAAGRARLMAEPFAPAAPSGREESVAEFAQRRLGLEAAQLLADALVSGACAGDPTRLSLEAMFPRLAKLERDHGSLLRGLVRFDQDTSAFPAGNPPASWRLVSFPDGMGEVTATLARKLDTAVRTGCPVSRIDALPGAPPRFRVTMADGHLEEADAVVVAAPAHAAARLLEPLDAALSDALAAIRFAPVAVVHVGVDAGACSREPAGQGFLVPRGEGLRMLGCLWSSSVFPHSAPAGRTLLRVVLGGSRDPEVVEWSDERITDLIHLELKRAMGLRGTAGFVQVLRQRQAIPQYELGHLGRLAAVTERLARVPGLFLAGNSYRGVGLNETVRSAHTAAEAVMEHLGTRPHQQR